MVPPCRLVLKKKNSFLVPSHIFASPGFNFIRCCQFAFQSGVPIYTLMIDQSSKSFLTVLLDSEQVTPEEKHRTSSDSSVREMIHYNYYLLNKPCAEPSALHILSFHLVLTTTP